MSAQAHRAGPPRRRTHDRAVMLAIIAAVGACGGAAPHAPDLVAREPLEATSDVPDIIESAAAAEALRARADAAHEARRIAEAVELDLALLARELPPADDEAIRLRLLETLAELDDPRQIEVLDGLVTRHPAQDTPGARLRLALLHADHGDAAVAAGLVQLALDELPSDGTRLYALRRLAGLHRRSGDAAAERACLREALELARVLNDASARRELEAAIRFVDSGG